jgi:hypothetical protein
MSSLDTYINFRILKLSLWGYRLNSTSLLGLCVYHSRSRKSSRQLRSGNTVRNKKTFNYIFLRNIVYFLPYALRFVQCTPTLPYAVRKSWQLVTLTGTYRTPYSYSSNVPWIIKFYVLFWTLDLGWEKIRDPGRTSQVIFPRATKQFFAVLRIRNRIHVFLGLKDPDPDPLVRGMDPDPALDPDPDPDPSIIKQN